ncbi:thioesterase II family protein [Streptomyces aidingensis]|uniref:Surfactin synthase thioesterase subunit n=1 Tax=Streptomyces aidingensis TaxID=910347 RepID=A0A1I1RAQ6_9ACTN|nr:alpha/beta fold hydrolase [Streptomyces aidingensis]SFD27480.1 Surfactin synthase thioesterase subunit [Streptomyces aidingensis]
MNSFLRPVPVERPAMRLFAFHHAGGSSTVYHPMRRQLPADWELMAYDLPGRGRLASQRPLEDIQLVLPRVLADIEPWLDAPVAFFGHSFGAIVASELARLLEGQGRPPLWVGVSGRVPPGYRSRRRLSELDDDGLLNAVQAMGGLPEQLTSVPEFLARFLQLTRADMRAVESYRPEAGRPPLSCPLTVFCGTDDGWAPPAAMAGWSAVTSRRLRRRVYPGGHFYFTGQAMPRFTRELVAEIRAAATAAEPAGR